MRSKITEGKIFDGYIDIDFASTLLNEYIKLELVLEKIDEIREQRKILSEWVDNNNPTSKEELEYHTDSFRIYKEDLEKLNKEHQEILLTIEELKEKQQKETK